MKQLITKYAIFLILFVLINSVSAFAQHGSIDDLLDMNIEQLLQKRITYTRNALRAKDYKIAAYYTADCNLGIKYKATTVLLKVKNITDADCIQPGVEQADAGDDFNKRSLGCRNSLLPQIGRNYMISLNIDI